MVSKEDRYGVVEGKKESSSLLFFSVAKQAKKVQMRAFNEIVDHSSYLFYIVRCRYSQVRCALKTASNTTLVWI